MLEVKRTQITYLDDLMKIIDTTRQEFAKNGIDQWQGEYPSRNDLVQDIMMNEAYTILYKNEIVGTLMMSLQAEPTYQNIHEGQWLHDGEYAVVHRFTIDPSQRRLGLATKALSELESTLGSFDSLHSVRIDTHKDNTAMKGLLAKAGYEYVGIIYLANNDERLAYEKLI